MWSIVTLEAAVVVVGFATIVGVSALRDSEAPLANLRIASLITAHVGLVLVAIAALLYRSASNRRGGSRRGGCLSRTDPSDWTQS